MHGNSCPYVVAVLDPYSPRIAGMVDAGEHDNADRGGCADDGGVAPGHACGGPAARLGPRNPCTSEHFRRLHDEQNITCSMSRAGEVRDSSAIESFFRSLKTERVARNASRTLGQARSHVFDYIERFYNLTRRHSTLGDLSTVQFEQAQES